MILSIETIPDLSRFAFPKRQPSFDIDFELNPFPPQKGQKKPNECNWIDFRDFGDVLKRLHDGSEIVLPSASAQVIIDHPVDTPALVKLAAPDEFAFTRLALVQDIFAAYVAIYRREDETSTMKVLPKAERQGSLNRQPTDGAFGVRLHDLDDLALELISVYLIDRTYVLELSMLS